MLIGWRAAFAADFKDICGERTARSGTVFTLTVNRSFEPEVIFKLCDREDKSKRFLLISTNQVSTPTIGARTAFRLDRSNTKCVASTRRRSTTT